MSIPNMGKSMYYTLCGIKMIKMSICWYGYEDTEKKRKKVKKGVDKEGGECYYNQAPLVRGRKEQKNSKRKSKKVLDKLTKKC